MVEVIGSSPIEPTCEVVGQEVIGSGEGISSGESYRAHRISAEIRMLKVDLGAFWLNK
jgi:hypothetical protein